MPVVQESEQEMRARWDAEILIQAKEIEADQKRLQKAKQAANKLLEEKRDAVKAVQKVVGTKRPSPSGSGGNINKTKTVESGGSLKKTINVLDRL